MMLSRNFKQLVTASLIALTANQAIASDSNPYSFMGLCQTQGSWTQEALQQTQTIRTVLKNLQNNPACSAVNSQMESLLARLEQQTDQGENRSKVDSLVALRRELGALASFSRLNTSLKVPALDMIVEKSLESASKKQSEVDEAKGSNILDKATVLANLGTRADRTMKASLNIFNEIIDKVPQASECLDNASMGAFLGASVKLLSTFAFDGNHASNLSTSISKLFSYMRSSKYSKALRHLNETEMRQSLSCLMEVTSENYCATEDAKALLNQTAADLQIRGIQRAQGERGGPGTINATNPLSGFMIASHHIPNVTAWLLNVQVGIKPQNNDDANNKNTQLENITTFFQMMNTIQGQFSQMKLNLSGNTDPRTQQTYALKSLMSISGVMMADWGDRKENFFRSVATERELPFLLLGFDKAPDEVLSGNGGTPVEPILYLTKHKDSLFANPIEVMNTIETNMNELIERAHKTAIETYNRWLIADPAVIALAAASSAPHSILESLKIIDSYLGAVNNRLKKVDSDEVAIMIPAIEDTRARIQTVLAAFRAFRTVRNAPAEQRNEMFAKIVEVTYYQFNILLSRAGFLSSRLNQVVYFDYVNTMRNSPNISRYEQAIAQAGYKWSFDRMIGMSHSNFSSVDSDLKNASRVNVANLAALELAFKDTWSAIIAKSRLEWEKGSVNGLSTTFDSMRRAHSDPIVPYTTRNTDVDAIVKPSGLKKAWDIMSFGALYKTLTAGVRMMTDRDKYPTSLGTTRNNPLAKSELFFLYSQYCTQALAFQGWREFATLCKDANLTPGFLETALRSLKPAEASYYQVPFVATAKAGVTNLATVDPKHPEQSNTYRRICALRDYHRRNNILTKIIQENSH